MIENIKQHGQLAAAVTAAQVTPSAALGKVFPLPTINAPPSTVTSITKLSTSLQPQPLSIPTLPYKTVDLESKPSTANMSTILQQQNQSPLRFNLATQSISSPSSPPHKPVCETYTVGSGVYVSRVTNIHITGPCTGTPHMPLKCAGDMVFNKRMCLDSRAVNSNKAKKQLLDNSCSMGKRLSQTRSLMVGGLCWSDRATNPGVQIHQPSLPITTSSSSTNMSTLITTASTSSSPAGVRPLAALSAGQNEMKGIVQEHKERRHIKAINDAFQMLRRALPWAGGTVAEKRPLGASATKMNTLRLATRYIRALEHLLEDNSEDDEESGSNTSSSQSSSCSPSPALSRTSLRSVGSDFSDLISMDSLEDLDALDELVALAEVKSDAFMSDTKKKLNT